MANSTRNMKWTAHVGAAGRLVIPARARKLLDLHQGQRVQLQVRNGGLEITAADGALERARAIARRHPAQGRRRMSDSLIQDRRKAAARGGVRLPQV